MRRIILAVAAFITCSLIMFLLLVVRTTNLENRVEALENSSHARAALEEAK